MNSWSQEDKVLLPFIVSYNKVVNGGFVSIITTIIGLRQLNWCTCCPQEKFNQCKYAKGSLMLHIQHGWMWTEPSVWLCVSSSSLAVDRRSQTPPLQTTMVRCHIYQSGKMR